MRKNDECVWWRGDKAGKNKFYKLAALLPRLIFILFSSAFFLCLTTSYNILAGRIKVHTKFGIRNSDSRTSWGRLRGKVSNGKFKRLSTCPRNELFMTDKSKRQWWARWKLMGLEEHYKRTIRRSYNVIELSFVIAWIKRPYCEAKRATVYAQLRGMNARLKAKSVRVW